MKTNHVYKTELVVTYHNFKPDYSLQNNKGGYCNWHEVCLNMSEAKSFAEEIEHRGLRVSSIYRRKIKY